VTTAQDRVFESYRRLTSAVDDYADAVTGLPRCHPLRADGAVAQLRDLVSFGLPWQLTRADARELNA
jgi:hypothetical protein